MNIIYIDVLVILNLYVTFFLLRATALFLHTRVRGLRYALGALLGGISSLYILLPPMAYPITVLAKMGMGLLIVFGVFGYGGLYRFIKYSLVFIIINMVFAGLMLMLWLFAAPMGMVYNNGYTYFDISFATILISTAAAYGLIKLVRYWLDSKVSVNEEYKVRILYNGTTAELRGFADSGNVVTDFFTGLPVIICSGEKLKSILPSGMSEWETQSDHMTVNGFRLLPYNTVGHSGIIPVFKPDEVLISGGGKNKNVMAMVGIPGEKFKDEEIEAIFNPKILK